MVAIVSFKREAIYGAVRDMYTAVALSPDRKFHFPTGRDACEVLGYPQEHLADVPDQLKNGPDDCIQEGARTRRKTRRPASGCVRR